MPDKNSVPLRELILVPSVITLVVTLLRLVGELQGWSPRLFNREPGGGGALVGIAWLVIVFGAWFAWKLIDSGHAPEGAFRPLAYGLGVLVAFIALAVGFSKSGIPQLAQLGIFSVIALAAIFVAMKGWP